MYREHRYILHRVTNASFGLITTLRFLLRSLCICRQWGGFKFRYSSLKNIGNKTKRNIIVKIWGKNDKIRRSVPELGP